MKKLLSLSISLLLTITAFTQAPQGFNYQAVIRGGDGEIIASSSVDVTLTVRQGTAEGTIVLSETFSTETNEFGLVNLKVGSIDPEAFASINWASGIFFLEVLLDGNSMGTSQLLSVPYALYAASGGDPQNLTGAGEAGKVAFWTGETSLASLAALGFDSNLEVVSPPTAGDDDPIFEVKNREGQVVFGVYQSGVRIYIENEEIKSTRSGFAIGGLTDVNKENEVEFFRVTPDSTRVYVRTDGPKSSRGGFAIGGLTDVGKDDASSFMFLTPENYFIGHNSGVDITTGIYNSALGYESAASLTSGESNAFMGYQSGYQNSEGSGNLFLGYQSGYSNTDGDYNTFVGYLAGHSNTDGVLNSFMGSFSGFSNTTGSNNTFVGDSTGYHNLFGNNNTFLGTRTGLSNVDGHSNVFIGNQSGYGNENGFDNIFIGNQAGFLHKGGEQNIFFGNNSGYNSIDTWGNVFIGFQSGKNTTTGSGNVFIGGNAGYSNTTGYSNTFLGINAGYMFDGDYGNTFIGDHAGHKVTNSHMNLFLGPYAGYNFSESDGESATNIFLGPGAGYNSTAGGSNVFIGFQSGYSNVESNANVFLGYKAGRSNETGWANVFIGGSTGSSNTTGHGNVFLGANTGIKSETGDYNTFIGAFTGENIITGTHNVFLGTSAGHNNNGDRNVFLGQFAGHENIEGSGNVFIGPNAGQNELGSNKFYIANSEHTPLIYGDFQTRYVRFNSRVSINGDPDTDYNLTIESFPDNTVASLKLDGTGDWHNYSRVVLSSKGLPLARLWQIAHSKNEHKFQLYYHDGIDQWHARLIIDTLGTVSSNGNITPLNDNVFSLGTSENNWTVVYATNGIIQTSDIRLKTNIASISYGINEIMRLNPISFEWIDDDSGRKKLGLVAQDVEEVIGEVVSKGDDAMQTLGIHHADLIPVLIKGMQEQQGIIDSQQEKLDLQAQENDDLKARLERLEQIVLER